LGENLEEDSNKGFSYIISSWLMEEEQECIAITLYILRLLAQLPQKIFSVFIVVALGSISSASQYRGVLVGLVNKITLARMPIAC